MTDYVSGYGLIMVASVAVGVVALPLRRRHRYAVASMWLLAFMVGYVAPSHVLVQVLVPDWRSAMAGAGMGSLATAALFGVGWGTASVMFAYAVVRVGVSLAFAISMGINTAVGSLVPLMRRWEAVPTSAAVIVLVGIGLCVFGVAVCGRAGVQRQRSAASGDNGDTSHCCDGSLFFGLVLCVMSGVLSACANLGFEAAEPVARHLVGQDVHPTLASICRWLPVYWGGGAAVLACCAVQLTRGRDWGRYRGPGAKRDLVLSLVMAGLLSLTHIPYGMGAYYLGALGTCVGWAVYVTGSMVIASFVGVLVGEWRGSGRGAGALLASGAIVLLVAMALLAWGNAMA